MSDPGGEFTEGGYMPPPVMSLYFHDRPDGRVEHIVHRDGVCLVCGKPLFDPQAVLRSLRRLTHGRSVATQDEPQA